MRKTVRRVVERLTRIGQFAHWGGKGTGETKKLAVLAEAVDGRTKCAAGLPAPATATVVGLRDEEKSQHAERQPANQHGADEEYRKTTEYLETVFNCLHTGIALIDEEEHRIADVNGEAARMISVPREEFIGSAYHDSTCTEQLAAPSGTGRGRGQANVDSLKRNTAGGDIPVIKSTVPVTLGRHKYLPESFIDISGRKNNEELFQQRYETFAAMLEHNPGGVILVSRDGSYQYVNPEFTTITGYALEDVPTGRDWIKKAFLDPEDERWIVDTWKQHRASGRKVADIQMNIVCKNGAKKHIECRTTFLDEYNIIVLNDITDRKEAEIKLKESEERYKVAIERYALAAIGARDGLWDLDVKAGHLHCSERWHEMLGYAPTEESSIEKWIGKVHPEDKTRVRGHLVSLMDGTNSHAECEYRMLHKDGKHRWVLTRGAAVRDENGSVVRMAGSQTDITSRKETEERNAYQALHDELTDLPNRRYLLERLNRVINRSRRRFDTEFAVLFIEIDRLSEVNDSFGHSTGEELIVQVGKRLQGSVRPTDAVARVGDSTFVALIERVGRIEDATIVADRFQAAMSAPMYAGGHELFAMISIGITSPLIVRYNDAQTVLRDADIAMHHGRAVDKTAYTVFDPSMYKHTVAALTLENDLRHAIEQENFRLHYQPIISLDTGKMIRMEALVRWEHPTRGIVALGEFIEVAERTGLIVPLGRWILRQACRQLRAWQKIAPWPITVCVNISARQFNQPDFIRTVKETIEETGIKPEQLELEITETSLLENAEPAIVTLSELKALGISISLDDFGTGYSSLSYLHKLPVDILKIDRSFINCIGEQGENSGIARTILALAHDMGIEVIAEGIERLSQIAHLKMMGCEYGQGYLFSRPLNTEAMAKTIRGKPSFASYTNGPRKEVTTLIPAARQGAASAAHQTRTGVAGGGGQ